jgi:hypothetical protein
MRRSPGPKRTRPTVEHIDNNNVGTNFDTNITLCCHGCNASKGARKLLKWFGSDYCNEKNINGKTVSPVVRNWLKARKFR